LNRENDGSQEKEGGGFRNSKVLEGGEGKHRGNLAFREGRVNSGCRLNSGGVEKFSYCLQLKLDRAGKEVNGRKEN